MAADYEYYRDTYLGSLLTEENFPKYALRADSYLDLLTTGRYEKDCLPEKAVEAVKMAECAIAELCLNLEQDRGALSQPRAGRAAERRGMEGAV